MRKKFLVTLAVIAVLGLVGCQNNYTPEDSDEAQKREEKVEVEETSDLPETDTPTPTPIVEEDIFEYEVVDNAIVITGLKEEREHIVIPSEIDGMTVMSIGKNAFKQNDFIISVEIPNSVTYIGERAFSMCGRLESIKIPKSVKEIVGTQFHECNNLKVIVEENSYAKEWAIKELDTWNFYDYGIKVYYYSSSRETDMNSEQESNASDNKTLSERVGGRLYVGDEFTLGTYEQDNYIDNGKDPIEWIVLSKDEEGYTCISKYVLDVQYFSKVEEEQKYPNRWSDSFLREWLNDTFYNEAFSDADKLNLCKMYTKVYEWQDSGEYELYKNSVGDMVRVLNYGELDEHPGCVKVTEYAKLQGAKYIDDGTREHENCSDNWCLMSYHVDHVKKVMSQAVYDRITNRPGENLALAIYEHEPDEWYLEQYGYTVDFIEVREWLASDPELFKVGVRPVIKIQLNNY